MKASKLIFIVAICGILFGCTPQKEESNHVKNVIILIADGASIDLLTLSRWFNDNQPLALDPYLCGLIRTHNADGKFPDSAPTSTAYATGVKSITPYIGIDSNAEPRVSVLELAKRKGLATGVVATSEFTHATPADFVCHFNSREGHHYKNLAKQFIYNSPNLVFAGGEYYLETHNYHHLLEPSNISLINDKKSFENLNTLSDKHQWVLFPDWKNSKKNMSYECDRIADKAPSLSEMTDKAIQLLSQNKNGFFLMVEGSQIDWAVHNNDPYSAVTEFMEFNKAVEVALKFAKTNKNTVVIICADHATGGLSMGNSSSGEGYIVKNVTKYDNIDIKENIIEPLRKVKWSSRKLAGMMLENADYISKDSLKKYYNTEATTEFLKKLKQVSTLKNVDTLQFLIGENFSRKNFIGWTTTGHTAEDVFLAIYTPEGVQRMTGVIDNHEIGKYIAKVLKLDDFDAVTKEYFTKHTSFFTEDEIISLCSDSLVVMDKGKKIVFESNSNLIIVDGVAKQQPSINICINGVYYINW